MGNAREGGKEDAPVRPRAIRNERYRRYLIRVVTRWAVFWTKQSLARRNQKEAAMHEEKNLMGLLAKWKRMARGAYGIASRKEG
jgi:hypothetical protein